MQIYNKILVNQTVTKTCLLLNTQTACYILDVLQDCDNVHMVGYQINVNGDTGRDTNK